LIELCSLLSIVFQDSLSRTLHTSLTLAKFIASKYNLDFKNEVKNLMERIALRMIDNGRVGLFAIKILNTRENKNKISTPLYRIDKVQNIEKEK